MMLLQPIRRNRLLLLLSYVIILVVLTCSSGTLAFITTRNINNNNHNGQIAAQNTHFKTTTFTKQNLVLFRRHCRCDSILFQSPSSSSIKSQQQQDRQKGLRVLLTVPLAWGTFEPAVRFVYSIQPPIPPFVFSVMYYLVAALSLWSCVLFANLSLQSSLSTTTTTNDDILENEETTTTTNNNNNEDTNQQQQQQQQQQPLPIQGGLELGTYLFIGNGLQVVGLQTVASDRAAFLLQLTTIFVPLVQAIMAQQLSFVPWNTWIACSIALMGVGVMGLDGQGTSITTTAAAAAATTTPPILLSIGDLEIILAALFYTFHCIRLEIYAKQTSAIRLAAAKATVETMWSSLVVLGTVLLAMSTMSMTTLTNNDNNILTTTGQEIVSYIQTIQSQGFAVGGDETIVATATATLSPSPSTAIYYIGGSVLWTGLVTVAYTIYAQSFGQSRVPPATANLIYTIQPICTALVAYIVLGETLGPAGYIGGSLIGAAVLLILRQDDGNNNE